MKASMSRNVEPVGRVAPGLIIRQRGPNNLESSFDQLDAFLTPADRFYVRSHFLAPELDLASFRLRIDGAVGTPLSLSYDELRAMRSETRIATLECAGNGRVFLVPPAPGAQWGLGAVGNAEWTGVPLSYLLERAGLAEDACEVVLEGADRGTAKEPLVPPGTISYARSLSRRKALRPEVLIAFQMNGRDLSLDHGFPVRAIVPGHYAMASVKWLRRIQVVREPFFGYWQTSDYAYWATRDGRPERRALGEMSLKSQIARPQLYETLALNRTYRISGAAWAGEADVTGITVSTDSGRSWQDATFIDPVIRHAWRRWEFDWLTPKTCGRHILLSRAKDSSGNLQPDTHDPNHGSYVISHPLPIEVFVGKR
jgi:DMSO/TMAO reductase YedYZ molybdopterin-dependent catalytic subunit